MSDLLLSIDQGTTSTKVTVLDFSLEVQGSAAVPFAQHYPQPGWVEHDATEIWSSTVQAIAAALKSAGAHGSRVAAIGITNQRETTVLWERSSGQPVAPAIVWQCRRTADACGALRRAGHAEVVRQRTGLVIDAYFSATKIRWILDRDDELQRRAEAGELAFGTIDSWLVWNLTGGAAHKTDASNASRTMLMGLDSLQWEQSLLELFGVPRAVLPQICGSAEIVGHTRGVPELPDGIPISGMAGDQQAALFGQACFSPGEGKITFGTGSFLLVNTGNQAVLSNAGMVTTVAWLIDGRATYALEGSAFVAGAAVQWLRDGLGIIQSAQEVEALAASVDSSDGVIMVPAFTGLGAPHWREDARAAILHLTRGTTRAHIARATLEGIALQNADIVRAMEQDRGERVAVMKVDGGASVNDLLMQFQADYCGRSMVRPRNPETTTLGAAMLAGLGAGVFASLDALRAVWQSERHFEPALEEDRRQAAVRRWLDAVSRVGA